MTPLPAVSGTLAVNSVSVGVPTISAFSVEVPKVKVYNALEETNSCPSKTILAPGKP